MSDGTSNKDRIATRMRSTRDSIVFQQFRSAVAILLLLGVMCVGIVMWVYVSNVMEERREFAGNTAAHIVSDLEDEYDLIACVRDVMGVYTSQIDAGLEPSDGEAYFGKFERVASMHGRDGIDRELRNVSMALGDRTYFALVGFDEVNESAVYVAGGNETRDTDPQVGDTTDLREWVRSARQDIEAFPSAYYFSWDRGLVVMNGAYLREGDLGAGCVLCVSDATETLYNVARAMAICMAVIAITVFIMWVLFKRRIDRLILKPLYSIGEAAQSYVDDRLAGKSDTQHFQLHGIRTGNEIDGLANVLSDMERDLSAYVKDLTRVTAENERRHAELEMAAQIQRDAMPFSFPAFPDRSEFDIYASMEPAREVGGDFYDMFLVDDDHLCIVIADVSDKGVPAALFMMTSKTTIAGHMMSGKNPGQGLADANDMICAHNQTGMFVTVWVGVLEISTGILTSANAGHEYPAVMPADRDFYLYKRLHGLVAGAMKGIQYQDHTMQLEPGSKLFVYTDGVPEATNAQGEQFGLDCMVEALNGANDGSPQEILQAVRHAVDEFVGDAEQFDDLTMLCLEYRGNSDVLVTVL